MDSSTQRPRTLGETLGAVSLADAIAALGCLVVIVGSLGPWISSPLASPSGINGDGQITGALAVIGLICLGFGRARALAALISLAVLGMGIYEYQHIRNALGHVMLFGVKIGTVGWGVYAVIGGAVIAGIAAIESYIERYGVDPGPGAITMDR